MKKKTIEVLIGANLTIIKRLCAKQLKHIYEQINSKGKFMDYFLFHLSLDDALAK